MNKRFLFCPSTPQTARRSRPKNCIYLDQKQKTAYWSLRAVKIFMTRCCWVTRGACVKFPSGKTYICFLFFTVPLSWDFITTHWIYILLLKEVDSVKIESLPQFPENTNINNFLTSLKLWVKALSFGCWTWNIGRISLSISSWEICVHSGLRRKIWKCFTNLTKIFVHQYRLMLFSSGTISPDKLFPKIVLRRGGKVLFLHFFF